MLFSPRNIARKRRKLVSLYLVSLSSIFFIFPFSSQVAEMIRPAIDAHTAPIPTVLEIPSKEQPYDESKDPIMVRVNALLGSRNED